MYYFFERIVIVCICIVFFYRVVIWKIRRKVFVCVVDIKYNIVMFFEFWYVFSWLVVMINVFNCRYGFGFKSLYRVGSVIFFVYVLYFIFIYRGIEVILCGGVFDYRESFGFGKFFYFFFLIFSIWVIWGYWKERNFCFVFF